jgi:hypothetical protein
MAMMPKTPLHVRLDKCSLVPRRRFALKKYPPTLIGGGSANLEPGRR